VIASALLPTLGKNLAGRASRRFLAVRQDKFRIPWRTLYLGSGRATTTTYSV